jgi:hypothetical protein
MRNSVRSLLSVGVAAVTAVALTVVPSVPETTPQASPTTVRVVSAPLRLTAAAQPQAALPDLLVGWLDRIIVPPSAGAPFPEPDFPPVIGGTSIDATIKNIYNAVEPWVQYGFELATYAVGWIPYVGWLSGQIMIFYFFGERIARSITFNIADWLGGNVSFVQGLINVGIDTVNSFIQLGIDEWNFFLPPLPPRPPFPFAEESADAELMLAASDEGAEVAEEAEVDQVGSVGEDLTQEEAVVDDEENLGEDVDAAEESLEETEPAVTETDPTTTDSTGTIQAQGEIRGSDVQSPAEGVGEDAETAPTEESDESGDQVTASLEPSENDDTADADADDTDSPDTDSPKDE